MTESKFTIKLNGNGFYSSHITILSVYFRNLVTIFLSVHYVHTHKHGSPVAAFGSTGTGCYLQYRAVVINRIAEHVFKFKLFQRLAYFFKLDVYFCFGNATFFKKFLQYV